MDKTVRIKTLEIDSVPKKLFERRWPNRKWANPELEKYVASIVQEVKNRGDSALIEFTKKFDGVEFSVDDFKASPDEIEAAYGKVKEEGVSALNSLKNRIERLERRRLERMTFESEDLGVKVYFRTYPIRSVGCYVPGGEAAYPTTLVMTATPARLAGVRRIVVCSPPDKNGELNPLTLVAADLCKVDEVYRIGGAQAIAALAYGTGLIKPVEKIVGPGNKYVTAAKVLVSRDVSTDAPAGPTEVLIVADDSADPRLVALDMVSQAEHGADSIPILVTVSKKVAKRAAEEIDKIVPLSPRKETVAESLSKNGLIITCRNLDEAVEFANKFAPEHLEVITKEPPTIAERVESAGLILTGSYSPVSASDYAFGTNHVLPTGGFGHIFSGLSVFDFIRRVSVIECSKSGLLEIRDNVKALAEAEGLLNHSLAVEERFSRE